MSKALATEMQRLFSGGGVGAARPTRSVFSEDSPLSFGGAEPARDGGGAARAPAAAAAPSASLGTFDTPARVGVFASTEEPGTFRCAVMVRGSLTNMGGFPSVERATEAYQLLMQGEVVPPPGAAQPEAAPAPAPAPSLQPSRSLEAAAAAEAGAARGRHYLGVSQTPYNSFTASISRDGKHTYIGAYPTAERAAAAYDAAVRRHGGAIVNFPRFPGEKQAVPRPRKSSSAAGQPAGKTAGKKRAAPAAPPAPPAAPAAAAPGAEPNKRKRGRPRKVVRDEPEVAAAAASPAPAPTTAGAVAAAQFRCVTFSPQTNLFNAWISFCDVNGGVMRLPVGSFGTAEAAARGVDDAARARSLPELLNFPTEEERAAMGRHTRSTPRTTPLLKRFARALADDEEEPHDLDRRLRSAQRRRVSTPPPPPRAAPASAAADDDDLAAMLPPEASPPPAPSPPHAPPAPATSPPPQPSPPPAPPPAPLQQQSPPATPDALTLLAADAPAPEAEAEAPPAAPGDDVAAFLRSIEPPLLGLAAAVAAAPRSRVLMRHLRLLQRLRGAPCAVMAAYLDDVAAELGIADAFEKMDLLAALEQLK